MAFNNGPRLVTQGLAFLVDAADPNSYPGSGNVWTDTISRVTGSISGSVSYSSDFYGGFVFSSPTASIAFPGTVANYGSGSFTVELAFRPARIQGIHYLVSKNSGSFPSWGVYLSGSGGSGKLFSEFRISSTVSCSVSSSTTFVTGSNYQVDVRMVPANSASGFYVDGVSIGGGLGNGGGSLTSTGSLFLGNVAPSSSLAFSGSVFASKIYSVNTLLQPQQNYNAVASRLSKAPLILSLPTFELLVVAGGGSGGSGRSGGGGGAGGLQYISSYSPTIGNNTVIVGAGGSTSNGQNSSIGTYVSIGGGRGGGSGNNGGSGGGGGGGATSGGSGIVGQGNNGGNSTSTSQWTSGGGGGASTSGSANNGNTNSGGGGTGSFISSFAPIGGFPAGWFAGGGGGGTDSSAGALSGSGGRGGGGDGGYGVGTAGRTGSANTGGGGGGSGNSSTPGTGGSGIVAIRYSGPPIAIGGEITQSAGFTYHVYRTVGTSSFTIF